MAILVRTYNMKSKSALNLKDAGCVLYGGKTNKRNLRKAKRTKADLVVNWGSSKNMPFFAGTMILNLVHAVQLWSDKMAVAKWLEGLPQQDKDLFIEHTTDKETAQYWLDSGVAVVNRSVMKGSNGRGITITDPDEELPDVPLYTKYFKKKQEYRVHMGLDKSMDAKLITVQRKGRRRDAEYSDGRIRNAHDTGAGSWVFLATSVVDVPQAVLTTASRAIEISGLDFGGMDIAYNEHYDQAKVIEINTAPGIGPNDTQRYMEFFRSFL